MVYIYFKVFYASGNNWQSNIKSDLGLFLKTSFIYLQEIGLDIYQTNIRLPESTRPCTNVVYLLFFQSLPPGGPLPHEIGSPLGTEKDSDSGCCPDMGVHECGMGPHEEDHRACNPNLGRCLLRHACLCWFHIIKSKGLLKASGSDGMQLVLLTHTVWTVCYPKSEKI